MNSPSKAEIRGKVLQNLEDYGLSWSDTEQRLTCNNLREVQLKLAYQTNRKAERYISKISHHIAAPNDINLSRINPYIVFVDQSKIEHRRLWAYATSFWSVPVTNGFGRRIRYFVFDRNNKKLMGVVGLADPIIGLHIRDNVAIGWSRDVKMQRLYNCMTAYILGAIPPYNLALGSKMVALTLQFPEVRKTFYHKYKESAREKGKSPYLAYVDTLGAFGKSAIYTKLHNWKFVGYTKGQSHLHITANGSWELIKKVVPDHIFESHAFGNGPNWKMRILKYGLKELDLSYEMVSVGWHRGYYRLPLAENWRDFLSGHTSRIHFKQQSKTALIDYWKNRWVFPRCESIQHKIDSLIK